MAKAKMSLVISLLYQRHPRLAAALLAVSVLYAAFEAGFVGAMYPLATGLLGQGQRFQGSTLGAAVWKTIEWIPYVSPRTAGIVLFVIVAAASFSLTYAKDVLRQYTSLVIRRDCQLEIFRKWMAMDYAEVIEHKQGGILFKVCGAPGMIGAAFNYLPELVAQGMKMVAITTILLLLSVKATMVLLGFAA